MRFVHPDDQTQPTYELTPGFKPVTTWKLLNDNYRGFEPLFSAIPVQRSYNEPIQRAAPSWLLSSVGKSATPVSQRSRGRIPYEVDFFSGFLFATAKVAPITAMIYFHIILHSAVHMYEFHIFISSKYKLAR